MVGEGLDQDAAVDCGVNGLMGALRSKHREDATPLLANLVWILALESRKGSFALAALLVWLAAPGQVVLLLLSVVFTQYGAIGFVHFVMDGWRIVWEPGIWFSDFIHDLLATRYRAWNRKLVFDNGRVESLRMHKVAALDQGVDTHITHVPVEAYRGVVDVCKDKPAQVVDVNQDINAERAAGGPCPAREWCLPFWGTGRALRGLALRGLHVCPWELVVIPTVDTA